MDKELVENFIMHPDWPKMVQFIEAHFQPSTDIHAVDTSKPASTIVGEVIATQKIDRSVQSLKDSFENAKKQYNKKKVSYE